MKKLEIYKAALELFVNEGFHGTSTAAIAKRACVANGTLFHYFHTKEALINDLFLEIKDNFLISVTENYEKEDDLKERFVQLWQGIICWATNNPNEFRFVQQFSNSPYINHMSDEQVIRYEHFFYGLFTEGKNKNIFKDLSVDLLLKMNFAQINGLIYYIFDHPDLLNDTVQIDTILKSLWDSLRR
jgi:AcrR family transcriptional regulator